MNFRDILRPQLEIDEGVKARMYVDTVGVPTIGVGHNLKDKPISYAAIKQILEDDIGDAEADARKLFPVFDQLTPARQAVVVNMAFNLGHDRLAKFIHTIRAINQGRYLDAAECMLASTWAQQVGARAVRLADAMRKG